jgi:hypothetical protein
MAIIFSFLWYFSKTLNIKLAQEQVPKKERKRK